MEIGSPRRKESVSMVTIPPEATTGPILNLATWGPEGPESDAPPVVFSPHPRKLAPTARIRVIAIGFTEPTSNRGADHYHPAALDRGGPVPARPGHGIRTASCRDGSSA